MEDHPRIGRRARKGSAALLMVSLLLLGGGTGCAGVRWAVTKSFRTPGARISAFPDTVWAEYDCEDKARPFFVIEENALVPPRVSPAGEFNHRFIYSMCPRKPTEVVKGTLSTRILFRGRAIIEESVDYEVRPGRWVVDAFVNIPENAEPGVYAYQIAFGSRAVRFDEQLTFIVQR